MAVKNDKMMRERRVADAILKMANEGKTLTKKMVLYILDNSNTSEGLLSTIDVNIRNLYKFGYGDEKISKLITENLNIRLAGLINLSNTSFKGYSLKVKDEKAFNEVFKKEFGNNMLYDILNIKKEYSKAAEDIINGSDMWKKYFDRLKNVENAIKNIDLVNGEKIVKAKEFSKLNFSDEVAKEIIAKSKNGQKITSREAILVIEKLSYSNFNDEEKEHFSKILGMVKYLYNYENQAEELDGLFNNFINISLNKNVGLLNEASTIEGFSLNNIYITGEQRRVLESKVEILKFHECLMEYMECADSEIEKKKELEKAIIDSFERNPNKTTGTVARYNKLRYPNGVSRTPIHKDEKVINMLVNRVEGRDYDFEEFTTGDDEKLYLGM